MNCFVFTHELENAQRQWPTSLFRLFCENFEKTHGCDIALADVTELPFQNRAYVNKTYRDRYRLAQLSARELEVLAKSTHVTASKEVLFDEHPRWKERGAASKRVSLAPSVMNEHLQDWLKSARGQEWAATREKVFQNPDAEECVDED